MNHALLLLRSLAPSSIKIAALGVTAAFIFVFGGAPQSEHADTSTSGIVRFDASGAGTKADASQGTVVLGINASAEIVGFEIASTGVHHGYVRTSDGTITVFDAPGAGTNANQGTLAFGIDAGGDTTGYFADTSQIFHGFIRAAGGTFTTFDAPGAVTANGYNEGTTPFAIDAGGDVTGYYTGSNGTLHGFVRAASGTFTSFDVTGAGTGSNLEPGLSASTPRARSRAYMSIRTPSFMALFARLAEPSPPSTSPARAQLERRGPSPSPSTQGAMSPGSTSTLREQFMASSALPPARSPPSTLPARALACSRVRCHSRSIHRGPSWGSM